MDFLAARTSDPVGLRIFFGLALALLLFAGAYMVRNRKRFFGYHGQEGDTYASANLRMWLVVLVWLHAVVITTIMIFEV